jgi:hypothetical protein
MAKWKAKAAVKGIIGNSLGNVKLLQNWGVGKAYIQLIFKGTVYKKQEQSKREK